ncbi:MAG: hypothetical protein U1E39_00930 [Planctomycetota bacterium]
MTGGAAARLVVGAAVVAGLVRAAWAFGASVAGEVGMDSPLRVAWLPVLLVGLAAGVVTWSRPARGDRVAPLAAAAVGAAAGLAWARATWPEGVVTLAAFLLAAGAVAAGRRSPDASPRGPRRGPDLPRGPAPLPDEDPPSLG